MSKRHNQSLFKWTLILHKVTLQSWQSLITFYTSVWRFDTILVNPRFTEYNVIKMMHLISLIISYLSHQLQGFMFIVYFNKKPTWPLNHYKPQQQIPNNFYKRWKKAQSNTYPKCFNFIESIFYVIHLQVSCWRQRMLLVCLTWSDWCFVAATVKKIKWSSLLHQNWN